MKYDITKHSSDGGKAMRAHHSQAGPNNINWKGGVSKQSSRYNKAWREKYPDKYKAQEAIKRAVRDGKIAKPEACSHCGAIHPRRLIHAHHHKGYAPECRLDVVWLCPMCHRHVSTD